MKKHYYKFYVILLCSFLMIGCDNGDGYTNVDGLNPTIELEVAKIQSEAGRKFTLKAIINDKDGLSTISLKSPKLNLDKTIDLASLYDELLYTYDLAYDFTTALEVGIDESFEILVAVRDVGGRVSEAKVLVTMDGDFNAPIFTTVPDKEVTVLVKTQTGFNLNFSLKDDKGLKAVYITIAELNYSKEEIIEGVEYNFKDQIPLPSQIADYTLSIRAIDKFDLEVTSKTIIHVSSMPDFEKMYLTDVKSVDELNSDIFGVPMLVEHSGEFEYKAKYYNKNANTELKFIPQKTDFTPICFGVDPNDNNKFTEDFALPLILPKANKYYEINFNVKTGVYSFETYTPTDIPLAIGEEVLLKPGSPSDGTIPLVIGLLANPLWPSTRSWDLLVLDQDPINKFLFTAEADLVEGTELNSMIVTSSHDWGWWPEPFWRFNSSTNPEAMVLTGGDNITVTIKKTGKYMFEFDTHLLRSKLYLINQ